MGDPLTRKFHWFSYVAGDDIRATCRPGDPDRFLSLIHISEPTRHG